MGFLEELFGPTPEQMQAQIQAQRTQIFLSNRHLVAAKLYVNPFCPSSVAIAENGYIGVLYQDLSVFHITDVVNFEIVVDGYSQVSTSEESSSRKKKTAGGVIGGAIAGGLLFGGIGALVGVGLSGSKTTTSGSSSSVESEVISSIELVFKINDFNRANVSAPLLPCPVVKGFNEHKFVENVVREIMGTLEVVERTAKEKPAEKRAALPAAKGQSKISAAPAKAAAEFRFCGDCGAKNKGGAAFCGDCGAKF